MTEGKIYIDQFGHVKALSLLSTRLVALHIHVVKKHTHKRDTGYLVLCIRYFILIAPFVNRKINADGLLKVSQHAFLLKHISKLCVTDKLNHQ